MRDGTINRKVAEEPMQANDLIRGDARRKTAQGSLEPRGAPFRLNPPHTKAFAGNLGVILGSGDQNHAVTLVSIPGIAISDIEGIRHQPGYPISGHLFAQ
jgi:hypothetical protein